jgi:hypothetical protein
MAIIEKKVKKIRTAGVKVDELKILYIGRKTKWYSQL